MLLIVLALARAAAADIGPLIEKDVSVPMRDGVVLKADVYRPEAGRPVPVLMTMGPYGKGVMYQDHYKPMWDWLVGKHPDILPGSTRSFLTWETVDPEIWVPWGYAVVRVDSRGAGRSPGFLDHNNARENRDFYNCIEWAAAQPWCSGKVGLNGISYYASSQWRAAALHLPDAQGLEVVRRVRAAVASGVVAVVLGGAFAARAAAIQLPNPSAIKVKTPDKWTLMGTQQKERDVPLKVTGQAIYSMDVRMPGMLYAAVKCCPVWGGDAKSYNFDAVKNMPGVHSIVRLPLDKRGKAKEVLGRTTKEGFYSGGVAIIADSWWHAQRAIDALPIEWDRGPGGSATTESLYAEHMAKLRAPGKVIVNEGNVEAAMGRAARVVEAIYSVPHVRRARMEPGNATVLVTDNRVDLWVGDQQPQRTLRNAAMLTGIAPEHVHLHMCYLGGGYGSSGNGPQAEHAVYIANTVRGRPVKMVWSREEDWGVGTTFSPLHIGKCTAALDENGWPIAMEIHYVQTVGVAWPADSRGLAMPPYWMPNYRLNQHIATCHIPAGRVRSTGARPSPSIWMWGFGRAPGRDASRPSSTTSTVSPGASGSPTRSRCVPARTSTSPISSVDRLVASTVRWSPSRRARTSSGGGSASVRHASSVRLSRGSSAMLTRVPSLPRDTSAGAPHPVWATSVPSGNDRVRLPRPGAWTATAVTAVPGASSSHHCASIAGLSAGARPTVDATATSVNTTVIAGMVAQASSRLPKRRSTSAFTGPTTIT